MYFVTNGIYIWHLRYVLPMGNIYGICDTSCLWDIYLTPAIRLAYGIYISGICDTTCLWVNISGFCDTSCQWDVYLASTIRFAYEIFILQPAICVAYGIYIQHLRYVLPMEYISGICNTSCLWDIYLASTICLANKNVRPKGAQ